MVRVGFLLAVVSSSLISSRTFAEETRAINRSESDAGFEILFNGHDLRNWKHQGNWRVVDGAITCVGKGGNLVCDSAVINSPYFELRFDWKIVAKGGKFDEETPLLGPQDGCFYTEFGVASTESDTHGKVVRQTGCMSYFYATGGGAVGLLGPERPLAPDAPIGMSTSSGPTRATSRPIGRWNNSRVVWIGDTVEHWLNGEKVVEFDFRPRKGQPSVVEEMIGQLRRVSAEELKTGLHVQIEVTDNRIMYRGVMLRHLPPARTDGGNE